MLAGFGRFYQRQFKLRPSLTLSVTNGILSGIADGVAQGTTMAMADTPTTSLTRTLEYDPYRTLRFVIFGFGMGPILCRWNNLLEKNFPLRSLPKLGYPSTGDQKGQVSMIALGKRVLADQAVMAPIGLCLFISSMGFMEGRGIGGVSEKFSDMFVPAILANWSIWPLIQLVNFRFMPLPYRVPFQSTCGIAWNLYLSLLNAKDDKRYEQDPFPPKEMHKLVQ